jgi:hypothetical protein
VWPGDLWGRITEARDRERHVERLIEEAGRRRTVAVLGQLYPILEARAAELALPAAHLPETRALALGESLLAYLPRPATLDSLRREGFAIVATEYAVPMARYVTGVNLFREGRVIPIGAPLRTSP